MRKPFAQRLIAGLEEFTKQLESGKSIPATRITKVGTPDGPLHIREKVMLANKLTRKQAEDIWDVLEQYAGAYPLDREMFIQVQIGGCTEYRFCGALAFGGKFWNDDGLWRVSCYKEDETPERKAMMDLVNGKLAAFRDS